jgi:hypothetical protein
VIEDCLDKDEFDNSALDDVIIFDDVHSGLLEIVSTLTHRKDEPYENYISRVINSPNLAPTCIKIADMIDNLTSKGVTLKQQAKYRRALPRLIKRMSGLEKR